MANRFEKATWPDRQVQYPSRRRLTATAESDVWDIERVEGEIIEAGKAFGDTNMSNLETRIYNAFDTLESSDVKLTDVSNVFTATTVDGALTELFQSAGSGKTAIATAIGSEANISDTFPQLATKISNGKLAIANALGNSALQTSTFAYLASLVALEKKIFVQTVNISASPQSTSTITQHIDVNIGFIPSYVFVSGVRIDWVGHLREDVTFDNLMQHDKIIRNITQNGFDLSWETTLNKYFVGSDTAVVIAIE